MRPWRPFTHYVEKKSETSEHRFLGEGRCGGQEAREKNSLKYE